MWRSAALHGWGNVAEAEEQQMPLELVGASGRATKSLLGTDHQVNKDKVSSKNIFNDFEEGHTYQLQPSTYSLTDFWHWQPLLGCNNEECFNPLRSDYLYFYRPLGGPTQAFWIRACLPSVDTLTQPGLKIYPS